MARFWLIVACGFLFWVSPVPARQPDKKKSYIETNYTCASHKITMRDGVQLHTIVYSPKDRRRNTPSS